MNNLECSQEAKENGKYERSLKDMEHRMRKSKRISTQNSRRKEHRAQKRGNI